MAETATQVELDGQYRALREEAGFLRRERACLSVSGADAAEYLQGQLTNDTEALETGSGCYAALLDRKVMLAQQDQPGRSLPLESPADLFTQFARSLLGQGPPPLSLPEAFRITEIALKARQAAESGQAVTLKESPYRTLH